MSRAAVFFLPILVVCQDTPEQNALFQPDDADAEAVEAEPENAPPVSEQPEPLLLALSFDEGGAEVTDRATADAVTIFGPRPNERLPGVEGEALALDGSTWVERPLPVEQQPTEAFTASAWLALASYPVSNAPVVAQYTFPDRGFFFGVDPWGRAYLAISQGGEWNTVWAEAPIPRNRYVHLAGTFARGDALRIYVDGELAGEQPVPDFPMTAEPEQPLSIGRDSHTPVTARLFETGLLTGALDRVQLHARVLDPAEIADEAALDVPELPPSMVPAERFADDLQRPRWHPLPPTGWTNEPHGLVFFDDSWHLFYQANPTGPYWAQIQWGHLRADDLVTWQPQPPALWPRPGFDERGVWSGDAAVRNGTLALLYTGVDGARAVVGLATSEDARTFERHPSPVIDGRPEGFSEFRDPYLLRDPEGWILLIGAGRQGDAGGAVLLYRSDDLVEWRYDGVLYEAPAGLAGIFWEMPVLLRLGEERFALLITTVEQDAPARALYWLGRYEAGRFVPDDPEPRAQDLFEGVLSPTVAEAPDGRYVAVGIVPETRTPERQAEAGWAHVFNLPRELDLCDDALCQRPAGELVALRGRMETAPPGALTPGEPIAISGGRQLELELELTPWDAEQLELTLLATPDGSERTDLRFDFLRDELVFDRSVSSLDEQTVRDVRTTALALRPDVALHVRVFIDGSLVEVFVDERAAFAARVYPTRADAELVQVGVSGGAADLRLLRWWSLRR